MDNSTYNARVLITIVTAKTPTGKTRFKDYDNLEQQRERNYQVCFLKEIIEVQEEKIAMSYFLKVENVEIDGVWEQRINKSSLHQLILHVERQLKAFTRFRRVFSKDIQFDIDINLLTDSANNYLVAFTTKIK